MLKVLYAVVDKEGNFRRVNGSLAFSRRKTAEGHCHKAGDCVVELVWDTDREPLHIKGKTLGDS
jgi:hypothetical protein